ncbi:MAG: molybdopterin molybdenumtransferase MoeA [Betaproteobacteria bacterium]|nr:molybdopterin molybdenumtransferase MoeA [Betaproteobacteria bacterium]
MRGFPSRAQVATALDWIERNVRALDPEAVALDELHGRVLASAVTAGLDVPAFDRAAMDGYALRGAETIGAAEYNPLAFELRGAALPGRPYDAAVLPGTAIRIMTGAPMPEGADAVVPAEFALERDGRVEIAAPLATGKNVGRRAEDVRAGAVVMQAGRRLRAQDVGLLASIGIGAASVIRRPRVRIVASGDELAAPGASKGPHQIYDANSPMLRGLAARDGALLESALRVRDDRQAIREAMLAPGADVVLISGGSSVGAEDHAPGLLAEMGTLAIHGIAMRPSSPAGFGRLGDTLVFLLPGNPVSCLCAYDFFAGRALRLLGGRGADWPHRRQRAVLRQKIASAVGRVDYCRVRLQGDEAEPLALSGASILSSTTRADGFVIVPEESEGYAPGTEIGVYLYGPFG